MVQAQKQKYRSMKQDRKKERKRERKERKQEKEREKERKKERKGGKALLTYDKIIYIENLPKIYKKAISSNN